MHAILVIVGLIFVFIIAIHLIFRVLKFTLASIFLILALVAVLYIFRQYFGIDLIGEIARP